MEMRRARFFFFMCILSPRKRFKRTSFNSGLKVGEEAGGVARLVEHLPLSGEVDSLTLSSKLQIAVRICGLSTGEAKWRVLSKL